MSEASEACWVKARDVDKRTEEGIWVKLQCLDYGILSHCAATHIDHNVVANANYPVF